MFFIRSWLLPCILLSSYRFSSSEEASKVSAVYNSEEWIPLQNESAESRKPPKASRTWEDPDAEIFLSIAEYRDSRCPLTLKNMFTKAKNPKRLYVGLIQQVQTEEDSTDCLKAYCSLMSNVLGECPYKDQIRTIVFAHHDSRGAGFAHHIGDQLRGDEDFCMQIDSHSDVVPHWDSEITAMWGSLDNEYAVLSTAVPDITTLSQNVNDRWEVPHLCQAGFSDSGVVRNLLPRAAMNLGKNF